MAGGFSQIFQRHQLVDVITDLQRSRHQKISRSFNQHFSAKSVLDLWTELSALKFFPADPVVKFTGEQLHIMELQIFESAQDAFTVLLISKSNAAG